jgi:hypothetical protein
VKPVKSPLREDGLPGGDGPNLGLTVAIEATEHVRTGDDGGHLTAFPPLPKRQA